MRFSDIIGQEETKKHLIRSVDEKRIPHAQLFWGGEGSGKLGLAIAYAQYLHCTNRHDGDSCGECPSCQQMRKLSHPDLHFAFPIIKKDNSEAICDQYITKWNSMVMESPYFSINQWMGFISDENKQGVIYQSESEQILRKLSRKSFESEYKVLIMWMPERMNEICANKLLKLIEEPPTNTVIILVSEHPENLLTTIVSRTQSIHIPPIGTSAMEEIFGTEIARIAAGNYVKAKSISTDTSEMEKMAGYYKMLMRHAWYRDLAMLRDLCDALRNEKREYILNFLDYCQKQTRESFIANMMNPDLNYLAGFEKDFIMRFRQLITEENIENLMSIFDKASREIAQNSNPRITLFDMGLLIATQIKRKN